MSYAPGWAPGWTPTLVLRIPEGTEDLTTVDSINVRIIADDEILDKCGEDVSVLSSNELEITLTQEESLRLMNATVTIQADWLYPGTELRWGTKTAIVTLDEQTLPEVRHRE